MATFIHTSRGLLNLDHVVLIKQGVAREAGENYVQLADGRVIYGILLDPIPGLPVAVTTPQDQDQLPPADEPKTAVGRWDGRPSAPTDTPYRDIAFRAGCPWYTCDVPNCQPECENYKISALEILRAAFPWDLPPERLEAMARGAFRIVGDEVPLGYIRAVLAAYRADPIMRELYSEKF